MKNAVAPEAAIGQSLGIVFEGIGRGFDAGVIDRDILVFLDQHKLNMGSCAMDGAGLNVPCDAQALRVGAISHFVQLFDGYVVTLAVLHTGIGQVTEQQQNDRCRSAELQISLGLSGHVCPSGKSPCLDSTHPRDGNQGYRRRPDPGKRARA